MKKIESWFVQWINFVVCVCVCERERERWDKGKKECSLNYHRRKMNKKVWMTFWRSFQFVCFTLHIFLVACVCVCAVHMNSSSWVSCESFWTNVFLVLLHFSIIFPSPRYPNGWFNCVSSTGDLALEHPHPLTSTSLVVWMICV